MNAHEESAICAFIRPERRTRWLESLSSSRRRNQILNRLNHCQDLDDRYATLLPSNTDVVALLKTERTGNLLSDLLHLDPRRPRIATGRSGP